MAQSFPDFFFNLLRPVDAIRLGDKTYLYAFGHIIPSDIKHYKQDDGSYVYGDLIFDDKNQIQLLDEWYSTPLPSPNYERDTSRE